MKRSISMMAVALAALSACASTKTPTELRDARAAYQRAESSPAAQTNRAGLMDARQALDAAEREYRESPSSDKVKTLGYVARRKSEIAEADGRTAEAKARQDQADRMALQMQAQRAQQEAEAQRQQATVQQRRAKLALERLGLEAKDEARGTVITLPEANMFAVNKAEILPSAKGRLTEIADAVKEVLAERAPQDMGRKIRLVGYTDDKGTDEHNMDLSKRRAEAVRKFFSEHGLDASMMETEGRGKADPVADNKSAKGRAENRRVEIVITRSPGQQGQGQTQGQGGGGGMR